MRVLPPPVGDGLSAALTTAAAFHVAGPRTVLLAEQRPGAERVPVAIEGELVDVAVPLRRSRRPEAVAYGAFEIPGHIGSGVLEDLPHPLA